MLHRFRISVVCLPWLLTACGSNASDAPVAPSQEDIGQSSDGLHAMLGELLPTGARITPTALPDAVFQRLNPDLPTRPDFVAGQAVASVASPDGRTLLILTSGYNRNNGPTGARIAAESNEYVFVYDISVDPPVKRQVIQVPNTFNGIAWNPNATEFYVSGGVNDNVHVFSSNDNGTFAEVGAPIALGHTAGLGLLMQPAAAGLAVNASGTRAVVANYENDSVTLVDLATRRAIAELDLRPGKVNPAEQGVPGGEYPFWVAIKGDTTAYVSSGRDHEVVVVSLAGDAPKVSARIPVGDQPGKSILARDQSRLFVVNSNSDTVSVIDTQANRVVEAIDVTAPKAFFANSAQLKGANPNSVTLSPDERTLYVTNGGTNSVAVIALGNGVFRSQVIGLIPTGWYPNSVSLSADGSRLYVVNGKANAGPNGGGCRDTLSIAPGSLAPCSSRNLYVRQLTKAGFLSAPVPNFGDLLRLTWQTAVNNHFPIADNHARDEALLGFIQRRIRHVIYIVKENRTYDQVLGDLAGGNADPALVLFPEPLSPNFHALARNFVNLDNFFDSGETSGDGWNWTTAARTADSIEKTQAPNYAGRGLNYDWEGANRNINVGFATVAERIAAQPFTPPDPDLLPGTADIAASDAPGSEAGTGYLWDAALRKGLSIRNYGFYGDLARYSLPPTDPAFIPLERMPFAAGVRQFFATKASLQAVSDPFFRGYDQKYPDFWRFKEWEREFDLYVSGGNLPALELVRLPHDHFGTFTTAIDGVNTVDTQFADNDYAVGLLVQKVAESPFANDTLIFVVEDDAQDGGDHVDAHRSTMFVAGPHVKQGAVVSTAYDTVSLLRTIEDVLGLDPLGITDGLASPMADVFEHPPRNWTFKAVVPDVLRTSTLPLPPPLVATAPVMPRHDAAYWAKAMAGQNFDREDALDTDHFNEALWRGLAAKNQGGTR